MVAPKMVSVQLVGVDLDETLFLAVEDRPIHVAHRDRKGLEGEAQLPAFLHIEAHVGDLRVGVGAPGRVPNVEGLNLDAAGVDYDHEHGVSTQPCPAEAFRDRPPSATARSCAP